MHAQDFHIDLADLSACGVYYVTREDIDTLAESVGRDDFNIHHIDLAGCRDQATFTARFAATLSLPDAYARDWSALVKYLQDMDGIPSRGHMVLFTRPEEWRQANPDAMDRVLDALEETAAIWAGEGVAFFVFMPRETPQAVIANSG